MGNFYRTLWLPSSLSDNLKEKVYNAHSSDALFEYYVYVISYIKWYSINRPEDYETDGAPINVEVIGKIIPKNHCSVIIKKLEAWEIIKMHKNYMPGFHSRHYKLAKEYEEDSYCYVKLYNKESKLANNFNRYEMQKASDKICEIQYEILNKNISISPDGLQWIKKRYKCKYVDFLVDNYNINSVDLSEAEREIEIVPEDIMLFTFLLKDISHPTRPVEGSRIYSNLSSLKRDYRKLLLLDGKPLHITDLINSQIVFSIPLIENKIKIKAGKKLDKMPADFELYKELAENGKIYEKLAEEIGFDLNDSNRKVFKQKFFKEIFFARVCRKRKMRLRKAFEKLFPSVTQAIDAIKYRNYKLFPINCQKIEATMLVKVLMQLHRKGIKALSIHDSIVVNNADDLKIAEQLMLQELKKSHNIKGSFKQDERTKELPPIAIRTNENFECYKQFSELKFDGHFAYFENYVFNTRTNRAKQVDDDGKCRLTFKQLKEIDLAENED